MGNNRIDNSSQERRGLVLATFVIVIGSVLKIYSSTLSSTVSNNNDLPPINTVKDLVEAIKFRNLSIGTYSNSPIHQLESSSRKSLRWLGRILKKGGEKSLKKGVEAYAAINTSHYAHITYEIRFLYEMTVKIGDISSILIPKESLRTRYGGILYGTSFAFKRTFSECLSRMFASGIMEKITDVRNNHHDEEDERHSVEDIVYIDMADLDVVFVSILIAYLISLFVLIIEMCLEILKLSK